MKHELIPNHEKLSSEEVIALTTKLNIIVQDLPKIRAKDKGLDGMEVTEGDVIKIIRNSKTAGVHNFYRVVIGD